MERPISFLIVLLLSRAQKQARGYSKASSPHSLGIGEGGSYIAIRVVEAPPFQGSFAFAWGTH